MTTWLLVGRAEWRSHRSGLVVLTVLTAVVGAVVLGALSAASRTASVVDRAEAAELRHDVILGAPPDVAAEVAAWDEVEVAAPLTVVAGRVSGVEDPVDIYADRTGAWLSSIDRPHLVSGRFPDWTATDEVLLTEPTAAALGLGPGDRFRWQLFVDPHRGDELGATHELVVVGVTRDLDDAVAPSGTRAYGTPAFARAVADDRPADLLAIRLRPDVGLRDFESSVLAMAPPGHTSVADDASELRSLHEGLEVLRAGTLLFATAVAVVGGLAVVLVAGRQVQLIAGGIAPLRPLGLTRSQCAACCAAPLVPVALIAAALAVVVAVTTSPLTSFGLAGRIERDPGINVDALVIGLGGVILVGAVIVAATWAGWRWWRPRSAVRPPRPSVVVTAVAAMGAAPASVIGARLALEGEGAVAGRRVRPALLAAVVGVAGITAAVLVGGSVDRLLETPSRYRPGWDAVVGHRPEERDVLLRVLGESADVAGYGELRSGFLIAHGRDVPAVAIRPFAGELDLPLLDGRPPASAEEVVVGSATAGDLDLGIGDMLTVPELGDRALRIVGRGVFPGEGVHLIGDGVWLDEAGYDAVIEDQQSLIVLRWREGADSEGAADRIEAALGEGRVFDVTERPREVVNVARTSWVPWALASLTAGFAAIALLHALLATVSRRRADLAVLRSLGFVEREVVRTIVTQAVVIAGIGIIVGMPLGTVLGRGVWRSVEEGLGVAPGPVLLPALLVAIAVGVTVAAALCALAPGRLAVHRPPAAALAAE